MPFPNIREKHNAFPEVVKKSIGFNGHVLISFLMHGKSIRVSELLITSAAACSQGITFGLGPVFGPNVQLLVLCIC